MHRIIACVQWVAALDGAFAWHSAWHRRRRHWKNQGSVPRASHSSATASYKAYIERQSVCRRVETKANGAGLRSCGATGPATAVCRAPLTNVVRCNPSAGAAAGALAKVRVVAPQPVVGVVGPKRETLRFDAEAEKELAAVGVVKVTRTDTKVVQCHT